MAPACSEPEIFSNAYFPVDSKRPRVLSPEANHRSGTKPQSKFNYGYEALAMQAEHSSYQPVVLARGFLVCGKVLTTVNICKHSATSQICPPLLEYFNWLDGLDQ